MLTYAVQRALLYAGVQRHTRDVLFYQASALPRRPGLRLQSRHTGALKAAYNSSLRQHTLVA
jgi:hypothetical protein